jgi:protein EFR3
MEPQSSYDPLRRDGISAHLRLAPALMHIENLSLQSLARSTRGVGVTDLRDALDGRSSMSNPALVNKAPSLSTLDHTSTHVDSPFNKLKTVRAKPEKQKAAGGPNDVRDMLSKLHIGKSNNGSNLLRASFPGLQRQETRSVRLSDVATDLKDADMSRHPSAKPHSMYLHTSHSE